MYTDAFGKARSLVLLALDACDPRLLRKYIAEGELPNIAALVSRGTFANMLSVLGFQNEVAALVAVDAAGAGRPVAVLELNGSLEHVVLLGGRVGFRHLQQVAQLPNEALRGRQFAGRDAAPAFDKCLRP